MILISNLTLSPWFITPSKLSGLSTQDPVFSILNDGRSPIYTIVGSSVVLPSSSSPSSLTSSVTGEFAKSLLITLREFVRPLAKISSGVIS